MNQINRKINEKRKNTTELALGIHFNKETIENLKLIQDICKNMQQLCDNLIK